MEKDYRDSPQGRWRANNPELYEATKQFQEYLRGAGIAWHNPLADECVQDFGCCTKMGAYSARITRHGQFLVPIRSERGDYFAKSELVHGASYLNANKGRGMRVGQWDDSKQRFLCIKPPEFGYYTIYEMPHFEDDDGAAVFEPITRLT